MKYFENCKTVEEAKSLYRELLKKLHPDCGGDDFECGEMIKEFKQFCNGKCEDAGADDSILSKIINFNCKIEIIGTWIYCFEAFECKDELKKLGFFFSGKHKAWIFSGSKKKIIRTCQTTDDNRRKWGTVSVGEKHNLIN